MGPGKDRISIGSKKKIAFVCSGGASKAGAFHLGVALALQEQGFRFFGGVATPGGKPHVPAPMEIGTYVGSSAGSMICAMLAAGYSLENIFNSFRGKVSDDPVDNIPKPLTPLTYTKMLKLRTGIAREQLEQLLFIKQMLGAVAKGDWESLIQMKWMKFTGLFSTSGIEEYMRDDVLPSNSFKDYPADLFIPATQLNHSRKVVFGKYRYQPPPHDLTCQYDNDVSISQAVAASTALPFIFSPYPIQNPDGTKTFYIDGEVRETLSTHVAVDAGADLIIASYTHQPVHLKKELGSLTEHGLPAILIQSIYLLVEQKINNHVHSKKIQRNAIDAVHQYCKQQGVSEEHRKRIIEILEAEMHHRRDVDSIYVHPSPADATMFHGEHFSLSAKRMQDYVRAGFRAGIDTLRRYQFADQDKKPRTLESSISKSGAGEI
ncbi:MAG: patatin-like phospholipase family protein [Bdellovibrionales bacterium]|nr:patatin-like phospholipase family protein [Bdellovibrionales bacterium]